MTKRSLSLEATDEGVESFLAGAFAGIVLGAALFLTPAHAGGNVASSRGAGHSASQYSAWTQYYNSRVRWGGGTKGRRGVMSGYTPGSNTCGGCTAPDPARSDPNYN